jgi:hypothetical protein
MAAKISRIEGGSEAYCHLRLETGVRRRFEGIYPKVSGLGRIDTTDPETTSVEAPVKSLRRRGTRGEPRFTYTKGPKGGVWFRADLIGREEIQVRSGDTVVRVSHI